jgi:hypothetical protein
MMNISFAWTSEAFDDKSKTETRRYWKPAHAAKFKPGLIFMGITKDFRAGGKRMHQAKVIFCEQQALANMTDESFEREGGTRFWPNKATYIRKMGGPDKTPFVLRFEHLGFERL